MTIKPPMLRPSDTIGVVSPASPPNTSIKSMVENLSSHHFRVKLGDSLRKTSADYQQIVAGTIGERTTDLMHMFENNDINMIMPINGGTGSAGILPFLDYEIIAHHPKILTGYGDLTILLNAITQSTGLITFLGLMAQDIYNHAQNTSDADKFNFQAFVQMVGTPTPRIPNHPSLKVHVPGQVTGRLAGGNLMAMISSLGTPYEIDTRGKILLIEQDSQQTQKVYRDLQQLKLAGKFDDCAGIVFGQFICFEGGKPQECSQIKNMLTYGMTYETIIQELLVPLKKPLVSGLAFSHGPYKLTLPIGAMANLDTANKLTIVEPVVTRR